MTTIWIFPMDSSDTSSLFNQQLKIGKKFVAITPEEDQLLKKIPTLLKPLIIQTCEQFNLPVVDIVPVGSSQRQTYLPGNRDIDIFVRLDTQERSLLENFASEVISALAKALKTTFEIKYAENPYGVIYYPLPDSSEYISVDVVVTIWSADTSNLPAILKISGMARTPFHMFYLEQHITGLEEEVRLFKYWTKQKKLYRQSGFTGFISELLIIIYGSFQQVLTKADEISSLTYDFHGRDVKKLRKKYANYPMILIDPIDKNRNAAAGIHGVLGHLHLNRFSRLAQESLTKPETLWQAYNLSGIVFTLKISFLSTIEIKNEEEYYSRIIKILGLVVRALQDQQLTVLDAIIDVSDSTLSFTTDSAGGNFLLIKGPPTHLTDHVTSFLEKNEDVWIEKEFYWAKKQQLTVQEIIKQKVILPDLLQSMTIM